MEEIMDAIIKKKRLILIAIIIFIGLAVYAVCNTNGQNTASANDEQDSIQQFDCIQKSSIEKREKLNQNSQYSLIYAAAKSRELVGDKPEDAIKDAETEYVEKQALIWESQNEGISVSDSDAHKHLIAICDEAKSADNYQILKRPVKRKR